MPKIRGGFHQLRDKDVGGNRELWMEIHVEDDQVVQKNKTLMIQLKDERKKS